MIKRIVTVLLATGFLAVALFAGNVFADIDVAGATEVSVVSATDEELVTALAAELEEPATTGITTTTAEHAALAGRWGVERIGVASAWDKVATFSPTIVAVVDTGIASDAPFADRIIGNVDLTDEGTFEDTHGHGTHMAGTIAVIAPNANLLNVKVADRRGRCDTATVAQGIRWAVDHGAQVINVSLEVAPSAELEDAVSYAWEQGAIVVVAAGNSGTNLPAYPAAYNEALAVAGTNQSDGLAVLSNYGEWVDIAAPGLKIYAERPAGEFGYETGTSPAAAHVSGVAALLFGVANDASGNGLLNDEVRGAIESTAQPLNAAGTGNGLVNAPAALLALAA
ncbi:MAG: S8 family serine peptidase [Dehalococcoidia bacterium]|nr:S8 family serine peptidase [Dehalococcoidia bacterium]